LYTVILILKKANNPGEMQFLSLSPIPSLNSSLLDGMELRLAIGVHFVPLLFLRGGVWRTGHP